MTAKIVHIAFLLSIIYSSNVRADVAPDPDETWNPCHQRSEGDVCRVSTRSSREGVCRLTEVGGVEAEYITRKTIARHDCTVLSKEGELLRARCMMCEDASDKPTTTVTPSSKRTR